MKIGIPIGVEPRRKFGKPSIRTILYKWITAGRMEAGFLSKIGLNELIIRLYLVFVATLAKRKKILFAVL